MTSPLAVVGLVFDGHDLQRPDLNVFFEITEGLDDLPEVRGEDQLIPFRAGRLPGLRLPHRRPIVATGHIMGPADTTAKAAFRSYVDEIKGWMDPTAGEKTLVATLEDGSTRWITCAARNILPGEGFASEYRAFSVEWEAVSDPLWHGSNVLGALDEGRFLNTGLFLDIAPPIVCNPTSTDFYYAFDVAGTTKISAVKVEIDGPSVGAVTVRNDSIPVWFAYTELPDGCTIVVDSGARKVILWGANGRRYLTLGADNRHGEYFRLVPGTNVIHISGWPAEVRIIFDATYL